MSITTSSYKPKEGVVIAFNSVSGNTQKAVMALADKLRARGCPKVVVNDLARCDMDEAIEDAFRYSKLVLAATTYSADVFPVMRSFLEDLTARGFGNRLVGLIENGGWSPMAAKAMRKILASSKNLTFTDTTVTIMSVLSSENREQLDAMADELCRDCMEPKDKKATIDPTALFHIGYGLYVVTCHDGKKDNGLIVNTVTQVTSTPNRVAVTINKDNYSHDVIKATGKMNVNCLSVDAPFSVFENFGFVSGRNVDKFEKIEPLRATNGLSVLPRYINSFMSLNVEQYIDLDTHGMFICTLEEARVISDRETMTYAFYHANVKPKPKTDKKKGYICKICGYIYDGDPLPEDFVCPLCKHGAADFEPIQ